MRYTENFYSEAQKLKSKIKEYNSVLIGAGAGLSAAAGFAYDGKRFKRYFSDFAKSYGITDMYTGGFYPFKTNNEFWGWWSRSIWINRYMKPEFPVYENLYKILKDKDYFVLTTNVDHCFQNAGFDKKRLFYTQGDFGLFQCSASCKQETYDNEDAIKKMLKLQGFDVITDQELSGPSDALKMTVPDELIPKCSNCGADLTTNLRIDENFVEDKGWREASNRYNNFAEKHLNSRILYWELGVGANTPGIIKYPFWQMTYSNIKSFYASINKEQAIAPKEILNRSILIDGDIKEAVDILTK